MRLLTTILCIRVFCAILCVSTCAACCSAQASLPSQSRQRLFDFHSGFWINLHPFLYWEALSSVRKTGTRPLALNRADEEELGQLSPEEHVAWSAAVSYYANSLTERDLLFDEGMVTIKNQLEDAETSAEPSGYPSSLRSQGRAVEGSSGL
jgi:hypothetical protein